MLASSETEPMDVVVCVPAHNEAEQIGNLLASLAVQTVATAARPLKVVVLDNNSEDATARVVVGFDREPRLTIRLIEVWLPPDQAHAGTARRLAMDAGAAWLETEARDGVLISTDADAVAPTTWVEANVAALAHADLVGGRIVIARTAMRFSALRDLDSRIERYWVAVRALEDRIDPPAHDPDPRHGDHTGASLALNASLYRAVGGMPAIPSGEDNALVSAVVRAGGRVRHCPAVWIEVSDREAGRAEGGMAHEMVRRREALSSGAPYRLPSAAFWRSRLQHRAAWRAEYQSRGGGYPNAIAYVAHREADAQAEPTVHVPVDEAIEDLETMAAAAPRAFA